jgi:hypothetical protein
VDFIECYDRVLDAAFCECLIAQFDASERKRPGATGHGIDRAKKDSVDVNISIHPEWAAAHQAVVDATWRALVAYMRKYAAMLTGVVVLNFPDPTTGAALRLSEEIVAQLGDATLELVMRRLYRLGTINLQRYARGVGGYHLWHSENHPRVDDPGCEALHRTLLFMYYLNDVEEGGETEFLYQGRRLRPTRGQLVVAPSGFTHTHRGNIPLSADKYILTSWVLFQPASELYG